MEFTSSNYFQIFIVRTCQNGRSIFIIFSILLKILLNMNIIQCIYEHGSLQIKKKKSKRMNTVHFFFFFFFMAQLYIFFKHVTHYSFNYLFLANLMNESLDLLTFCGSHIYSMVDSSIYYMEITERMNFLLLLLLLLLCFFIWIPT